MIWVFLFGLCLGVALGFFWGVYYGVRETLADEAERRYWELWKQRVNGGIS